VVKTLLALALAGGCALAIYAKDLTDYRAGDIVAEDIATPVSFMVVDPVATAALKEKEAGRIPVIVRFNPGAASAVASEIRAGYTAARSNFMILQEKNFNQARLTDSQMNSKRFQNLVSAFKRRNKGFPLSDPLAAEWARGNDGRAIQDAVVVRVLAVMEKPIRIFKNDIKLSRQVMIVPVTSMTEPIAPDDVKARGWKMARTNLLSLSRARSMVLERFGTNEMAEAKFAERSLRVNSQVETELTLAARARHTDPLFVADNYLAGQIIARSGQVMDGKIMAAVGQLLEKTAAGRLSQQVVQEKERVILAQVQATNLKQSSKKLLAGLGVTASLLLGFTFWAALRRSKRNLLPVALGNGSSPGLSSDPKRAGHAARGDDSWQHRALVAEEKAERAHVAIREGALAQFKEKLVGNLVSQQSELLEAQAAAAVEMAEMERRLNELHAPLQERLRTYETRIADLENALVAKGEENRELIKAKIDLLRKQLEAARSGKQLQFN
jgi:hypothetical protein